MIQHHTIVEEEVREKRLYRLLASATRCYTFRGATGSLFQNVAEVNVMSAARILSWNVNGIRAVHRKGFKDWLIEDNPDILCLQETRALHEQVPEDLITINGYHTYFFAAERKGYSGVGLFTREQPLKIQMGFGIDEFDREGRTIIATYPGFTLFNIYFPNGGSSRERLVFKLDFYDAFLHYLDWYRTAHTDRLVICGDFNTAHTELDLARPRENEKTSGFLPVERAWLDSLISHGFNDTFRLYEQTGGHYSWWDYKTRSRERNVGWRIDYFFVSQVLRNSVSAAFILPDVLGSDHCPVGLELENG